ncbi:FliG C-terminal domain-containing protein, partial [uncultured Treponema sp.]|uniref:FliG C-terminal domain-containing protein n=1 Tax=uncultured Treponema sp. TaxID=162155 RepID=UPI00259AD382
CLHLKSAPFSVSFYALILMEATAEVKDAFFRNMSKCAEQMITEDMQYNTDVSCKDSFEAQQKILDTIFGLEKSGKIRLPEK